MEKCSYCDAEATHFQNCNDPCSGQTFLYSATCQKHVGGFRELIDVIQGREYIKANPDGPFTVEAVQQWWFAKLDANLYPLPNPVNRKCVYCQSEAECYRYLMVPKTGTYEIFGQTCTEHVGLLTILQWNIGKEYIEAYPSGPFTKEAVEAWVVLKNKAAREVAVTKTSTS